MAHLFRFKGRMARLPFVGWTLVLMVLELVLYLAMSLITGHDIQGNRLKNSSGSV